MPTYVVPVFIYGQRFEVEVDAATPEGAIARAMDSVPPVDGPGGRVQISKLNGVKQKAR